MIFWRLHLGFLITALFVGLGAWLLLFKAAAQPHIKDDDSFFNHGSIGNEATQGIPYWIWRVLPEVFSDYLPQGPDSTAHDWTAFGFYWDKGSELPVGFSKKSLGKIPRVSPNCAICHQGSYRLSENSEPQLVNSGAGTQIDIQAFTRFLIRAAEDEDRFNADVILAAVEKHTELPAWEKAIYRYALIPGTKSALLKQAEAFKWMDSKPDWGIGRIDPFNPVKFGILEIEPDNTIGNSDMMPLWQLHLAEPEDGNRLSVHWDGLLTDVRETVIAGAIGDGMTYKSFALTEENLDRIDSYIKQISPPPSPFRHDIDEASPFFVSASDLRAGEQLYVQNCSSCHEPKGQRFRRVIPIEEIGTDKHRLDMWTFEAMNKYKNYQAEYDWGFEHFEKTNGYVAVDLTGLWLRGPYLHNGSVPNLRTLLMRPVDRPTIFYRGSDIVDTENGGFLSGASDDAKSRIWRVDTSIAGNSNSGHIWGTDLSPDEKEALLAYLKTK